MKKILLAFNGRHFSKAAIEFAENLNDKTPTLLGYLQKRATNKSLGCVSLQNHLCK
jgi:hypothetical protein